MADFLPTNTPRLKFTQTGPRGTHKMTFRVVPGTTSAAALSAATPVIEAMMGFMTNGTSWESAEWAAEGSDVFVPLDFTAIPKTSGGNTPDNKYPYGMYVNFVGRSSAGSRAAFYLFNVDRDFMSANNRISPAEATYLADIRAAFDANNTVLCAIDQNPFTLKNYANTGINDDVAKKSRALV